MQKAQLAEQEAAAKLAEAKKEQAAQEAAAAAEAAKKAAAIEAAQKAEAEAEKAAKAAEEKRAKELAAQEKRAAAKRKRKEPSAPLGNGAARLEEIAKDIAARKPSMVGLSAVPRPLAWPPTMARLKTPHQSVARRMFLGAKFLTRPDDAEPLELGAVAKNATPHDDAENAIKTIARLQHFTYDLETRLYGDPPPALQERFDRGDRNVFATGS